MFQTMLTQPNQLKGTTENMDLDDPMIIETTVNKDFIIKNELKDARFFDDRNPLKDARFFEKEKEKQIEMDDLTSRAAASYYNSLMRQQTMGLAMDLDETHGTVQRQKRVIGRRYQPAVKSIKTQSG